MLCTDFCTPLFTQVRCYPNNAVTDCKVVSNNGLVFFFKFHSFTETIRAVIGMAKYYIENVFSSYLLGTNRSLEICSCY